MTNNELSRKVLQILEDQDGTIRFNELTEKTGVDARAVFKNLFFLEEKGYVKLSTSYPTDAVYPRIHLVKLRESGEKLLNDPALLDSVFPLTDPAVDTRLNIPPELGNSRSFTFAMVLDVLANRVKENMPEDRQEDILEKIEVLLGLPFINESVPLDKEKKK
ncbi:MAG: winged helix-turn-helix domain-containing protein [bacterium]